jgi:hypothetical protein
MALPDAPLIQLALKPGTRPLLRIANDAGADGTASVNAIDDLFHILHLYLVVHSAGVVRGAVQGDRHLRALRSMLLDSHGDTACILKGPGGQWPVQDSDRKEDRGYKKIDGFHSPPPVFLINNFSAASRW